MTRFHSEAPVLSCSCLDQLGTLDRVAHVLDAALSIDLDDLERIVQEAHECAPSQMEDPEERFPISRQALRMFWHFRGHLEAVHDPIRIREGPPHG